MTFCAWKYASEHEQTTYNITFVAQVGFGQPSSLCPVYIAILYTYSIMI